MLHSIRWRLVASYVLLTLLTVSVVGFLALSLIDRYAAQQEVGSLAQNAEAIALQAAPLIQSEAADIQLRDLAQTSAFLGQARVRILDAQQLPLVDTGPRAGVESFYVVQPQTVPAPAIEATEEQGLTLALPQANAPASGVALVPQHTAGAKFQLSVQPFADPFQGQANASANVTIVRREENVWGSRLSFEQTTTTTTVGTAQAVPFTFAPTKTDSLMAARDVPAPLALQPMGRVVNVPIESATGPVGYVELSRNPEYVSEAVAASRWAFGLAALGASGIALIVGLFVSQGLTAPLHGLTQAADQMSRGHLDARAPVQGGGEIGQLTQQFNQMADRLESSFAALEAERDALRRFIADASHELRTPITALKTFNELLQGTAAGDTTVRAEFLAESGAQVDRLAWITHNLLDLSRLDAGLAHLELADHDVGEMVESAVAPFRLRAKQANVELVVQPPATPTSLHCDRARIELALSNLIDNALKFTPSGGHIRIEATSLTDRRSPYGDFPESPPTADGQVALGGTGRGQPSAVCRLAVSDSGPGIHPADQPRLFERFYRGRDAGSQGSGLGLAIVQSIVQVHRGRVWVDSTPGQGSRFVMELPGLVD